MIHDLRNVPPDPPSGGVAVTGRFPRRDDPTRTERARP